MTVARSPAVSEQPPRRHLATVDQLAERYLTPKSSMYDFLKARGAAAGVLRLGRRILIDVEVFDAYVSGQK